VRPWLRCHTRLFAIDHARRSAQTTDNAPRSAQTNAAKPQSLDYVDAGRAAVNCDVTEVSRIFIEDRPLPGREDELFDWPLDRVELGAFRWQSGPSRFARRCPGFEP